jgi:HK97 gp10 family phage protein
MAREDLAIRVDGLAQMRRSMGALDRGLLGEVRDVVKSGAEVVASEARRRAPVKSGRLQASIRGTTSGAKGIVRSPLPYANVQNWGGTIAPRGTKIRIRGKHFIDGALEDKREAVADELARGMEDLFRRHGWT